MFTKEYGSQCSLGNCALPKRETDEHIYYADDIISRSRREEIKTTIEKAKLGQWSCQASHLVVKNMILSDCFPWKRIKPP